MLRLKKKKGFTLAEALIVVGIIAVLATITVVAIFAYMRSMTKLEYDGYAKEIFIAAQNHLTMSEGQGYLGRTTFGEEEGEIPGADDTGDGVYYFVKATGRDDVNDNTSVLNLMLPFGAVDDTVRIGGCYIIRYHKDSAQVLDVFYWEEKGRYEHTYTDADYSEFINNREKSSNLKSYSKDNSVIGYYGGTEAKNLTYGDDLKEPVIVVENSNKLAVKVTDMNTYNNKAKLKLIITGKTSGVSFEIPLASTRPAEYTDYYDDPVSYDGYNVYEIVLDDITSSSSSSSVNNHFYNLFGEDRLGENHFIAGEDIEILAVSYNNEQLTNVAYSANQTTNSLFAYNDTNDGTAHISSMRHLENLDCSISNIANNTFEFTALDYVDEGNKLNAYQTTDLSWTDFQNYFPIEYSIFIYGYDGSSSLTVSPNTYMPVTPNRYTLQYDGGNYAISNVVVSDSGSAGLFGELVALSTESGKIENLKLVDFIVKGKDAGALAGVVNNYDINNVLAVHSNNNPSAIFTVSGTGSVGGLIGSVTDSSINKCAAALIVSTTGESENAGGLIGTASGSTEVTACYSGGHTKDGRYTSDAINVTGTANVGGLIGEFNGNRISQSYSTCSVSGVTSGGLIGAGYITGKIDKCYATGLVKSITSETKESKSGAFAGTLTGAAGASVEGCNYYGIINEYAPDSKKGISNFTYLSALGDATNIETVNITALDANASAYENFVGDDSVRKSANAYDNLLNLYYRGKYQLQTVDQLGAAVNDTNDFVGVHYGDWPAPEVFVINVKSE